MKNIYGAVLFFIIIGQSCQQKEVITKEEVMTVIERFDRGWKTKNTGLVDSVLAPSYIYFTQSGGISSRNKIVETAGSPEYTLDTVQRRQFDIQIEGNTAVVNTIWSGKGVYYGEPFDDTQRCSITIIKNKGKLEILSEHCTLIKK